MHLSAATQNLLAHIFDDAREFIRPDMGMSIREDGCAGAMLAENAEDAID